MNHWTPSEWQRIERHARAAQLCAVGARVTASDPPIAAHWHQEHARHAQELRQYACRAELRRALEVAA